MCDRVVTMRGLENERPFRDALEQVTSNVPEGPLGKVGGGNLTGALGYVAVESGEVITIPIPGANRPGFKYVSHSFVGVENDVQEYKIVVHAISKDVAKFAVEYKAAPSNYDFLKGISKVTNVRELDRENVYSTYEMTIEVDRGAVRDTASNEIPDELKDLQ